MCGKHGPKPGARSLLRASHLAPCALVTLPSGAPIFHGSPSQLNHQPFSARPANIAPPAIMSFTPRTVFPDYRLTLASFKGHHQKALTRFGHLAPQIDLILEVRDSRAPVSTTNVLFDRVLARKRKIVIYSKKDLLIMKPLLLKKWHHDEPFLFVDTRSTQDAHRILSAVGAFHAQMHPPPPLGLRAMIVGMPNVGKSTLVNTLRAAGLADMPQGISSKKKKKVARTGGQPGVTRNTSEIIRLSRDPDLLVYDTPGVFLPTVKDAETMLALSLVGCIQESLVDPVIQADYLLYVLNLQDPSGARYAEYMSRPTNDVGELLYHVAVKQGRVAKNGSWDQLGMAQHWTNAWRQGKLRKFRGLFDVPAILEVSSNDMRQAHEGELERLRESGVHARIVNSLGEDGTGTSKARNRTAKDREFDIRNQLFKL